MIDLLSILYVEIRVFTLFHILFLQLLIIIWLYLIIYNRRGYIHFSDNDSTIKFILTLAFITVTAVIARCGCLRDVQPAEDTLSNTSDIKINISN